MKIRVLPDSVANQIAAGEVVGNPSSVVKELTENAIDAGATSVTVNFRADGRELVQVIDNGCGMSPADARLAFDKHATSKIASLDDIYTLTTFGFRGEALPSIAAVAEVELTTRTADDELATRIVIDGGEFRSQDMVVAPVGSNFKVSNLFHNVPARRKFLESSEREAGKIKTEFRRVALCHPEVAFALYRDDAPLFNLPATTLKQRIAALMGKVVASQLLELSTTTTIVKVEGFVGRPECAKKRKDEQFFFVNGRFFKSPYLHRAVMAAYEKIIPAGLTPAYFIYLTVDTEKVDVNVHPQKTEVKFSEDSEIWQIVNAAVRESLAKTGAIPMMDFDDDGGIQIPVFSGVREGGFAEPRTNTNPFYNPFAERPAVGGGHSGCGSNSGYSPSMIAERAEAYPSTPEEESAEGRSGWWGEMEEFAPESEAEQMSFEGEGFDSSGRFEGLIALSSGYVATKYNGRLAIIDVAKAREWMLLRYYLGAIDSGTPVVGERLIFPEHKCFSYDDTLFLSQYRDYFIAMGFDYEIVGDNTIELSAYPAEMADSSNVEMVIYDMIDSLRDGIGSPERERKERLARILARSNSSFSGVIEEGSGVLESILNALNECVEMRREDSGWGDVVRIVDSSLLSSLFEK